MNNKFIIRVIASALGLNSDQWCEIVATHEEMIGVKMCGNDAYRWIKKEDIIEVQISKDLMLSVR